MAKFKIKVKITGFELEIEGDRQDIPALTRSVSKQLSGIVSAPSTEMFEDATVIPNEPLAVAASKPAPKRKRSGSKGAKAGTPSPQKSQAVTAFEMDTRSIQEKYGNPQQQWGSGDKLMWLMYVLEKESNIQGSSNSQLKETFNKHYRTAGALNAQHVIDLRKKTSINPALVGKDSNQEPAVWYLTEAGKKHAQSLISSKQSSAE